MATISSTLQRALAGAALLLQACSAGDPPASAGGSGVNAGGPGANGSDNGGGDPGAILGDEDQGLPTRCGDGIVAEGEFCDDGNQMPGDGCDQACQLELGWVCMDGKCEFSNFCGDGRVTPPELCDDGNAQAGDGCGFDCRVETDWVCPDPGQPCRFNAVCGDGLRASLEQCDDGNVNPGDGCSETCTAEPGFLCGDGVVAGIEDCDDGNAVAMDGCSADCKLEPPRWDATTSSMVGFVCDVPGQLCRASVCGDGLVEGGEPCDDGNNGDMGDGCSPGCRLEPNCSAADGTCTSSCGDGLILPGDNEECDDGNSKPGDGCDANCRIEAGFDCPVVDEQGVVDLPIVYRDFKGVGWQGGIYYADGHPDFENEQFSRNTPKYTVTSSAGQNFTDIAGPTVGLVNAQLGAGQSGSAALKPVFASTGTPAQLTSAASFAEWYTDVPGRNLTVVSNLALTALAAGTFAFDTTAFYPIDGQGLVAAGTEQARPTDWLGQGCGSRQPDGQWITLTGTAHNFSFTSEVRYWFEYQGGEQLEFRGDDDVWVFIKRQLVVDLGGNHEPYGGDVCGNIWSTTETAPTCAGLGAGTTDVSGAPLNLQEGRVYEVVVFQAERHTCQSNYRLTISNFARRRSQCTPICGDGIIVGTELCDDGVNDGSYGGCAPDCSRGPRCGDAMVDAQAGEQCDNGSNVDQYYLCGPDGRDATGQACTPSCGPGCTWPGSCGDGAVQSNFAEECDLGMEGNVSGYNGCNPDCSRGPHCGDGVLAEADGEECDDGNNRPNDNCSPNCKHERPVGAR